MAIGHGKPVGQVFSFYVPEPLLPAETLPFAKYDWPRVTPVVSSYALSDQAIWGLIIPFNQLDWRGSFRLLPSASRIEGINLPLTASPIINVDWSRPKSFVSTASDQLQYNLNLLSLSSTPFNQTDWPQTHSVKGVLSLSDQSIWALIIPFAQYDWSKPYRPLPSVSRVEGVNLALTVPPVQIPFAQTLWPNTSGFRYFKPPEIDGALIDTTQPFAQYDWSKPQGLSPGKEPPQWSLNLQLYPPGVAPVEIPHNQFDWPLVHRITGYPSLSDQGIWLFTIPFNQIDWSKASSIRTTSDQIYPNIVLLTPSGPVQVPFNQLDWAKVGIIRAIVSDQNNLPNFALQHPSVPSNPLGIFSWRDWSYTKSPVIIVSDQNTLPNIALANFIPPPPIVTTTYLPFLASLGQMTWR